MKDFTQKYFDLGKAGHGSIALKYFCRNLLLSLLSLTVLERAAVVLDQYLILCISLKYMPTRCRGSLLKVDDIRSTILV